MSVIKIRRPIAFPRERVLVKIDHPKATKPYHVCLVVRVRTVWYSDIGYKHMYHVQPLSTRIARREVDESVMKEYNGEPL